MTLYEALGTAIESEDPVAIQAAALAVGDDILTEYYYMDGNTRVYLKTINDNDLIKNKYWNRYLVRSDGERFPDWGESETLIEIDNYRTNTNPGTGSVADGWLEEVLGKDLYVSVTFINNGYIETIEER